MTRCSQRRCRRRGGVHVSSIAGQAAVDLLSQGLQPGHSWIVGHGTVGTLASRCVSCPGPGRLTEEGIGKGSVGHSSRKRYRGLDLGLCFVPRPGQGWLGWGWAVQPGSTTTVRWLGSVPGRSSGCCCRWTVRWRAGLCIQRVRVVAGHDTITDLCTVARAGGRPRRLKCGSRYGCPGGSNERDWWSRGCHGREGRVSVGRVC